MYKDDLIAHLTSIPGNPRILLSCDAEGNSFSELDEPCEAMVPNDYNGGQTEEVFTTEELVDESDPDEAVLENFTTVLVLWPV